MSAGRVSYGYRRLYLYDILYRGRGRRYDSNADNHRCERTQRKERKRAFIQGRTRRIVIVNKRVSEGVYYDGGPIPTMSIDYRVVGGKILYTKDIDEELFDRIAVGQTYKALIRDGAVKKIELC